MTRPIRWTRPALTSKVLSFEEQFKGDELVDALVAFADNLEPEDRKLFQAVLLERADQTYVPKFMSRPSRGNAVLQQPRSREEDE